MWIIDQDQANARDTMAGHRERMFAQELADEAMALRVAAGAVDLRPNRPRPMDTHRPSLGLLQLSARDRHETHLQSVHRA